MGYSTSSPYHNLCFQSMQNNASHHPHTNINNSNTNTHNTYYTVHGDSGDCNEQTMYNFTYLTYYLNNNTNDNDQNKDGCARIERDVHNESTTYRIIIYNWASGLEDKKKFPAYYN